MKYTIIRLYAQYLYRGMIRGWVLALLLASALPLMSPYTRAADKEESRSAWQKILGRKAVITAFIYYEDERELELFFKNGKKRSYKHVGRATWRGFRAAKDRSDFYRQHIQYNYRFKETRIKPLPKDDSRKGAGWAVVITPETLVKACTYNEDDQSLSVWFTVGAQRKHEKVPEKVYREFKAVEFHLDFYRERIEKKFDFTEKE